MGSWLEPLRSRTQCKLDPPEATDEYCPFDPSEDGKVGLLTMKWVRGTVSAQDSLVACGFSEPPACFRPVQGLYSALNRPSPSPNFL